MEESADENPDHTFNGGSRIQMPDDKRRRAETLGAFACQQLQNQDPSLWAKASDREFLRMIKQGAKILRKIGLYATLDLSEAEAQLALIACRFVALQPGLLSAKQRRIMQYLLLLLSRCCFISLDSRKPSELGNFGHRSRISPDLKRAYRDLLRGKPVSLSIATQLWSVRGSD